MSKRNPPDENETSTGCVIETPQIKMKQVWDVEDKLPRINYIKKLFKKKPAWDE